MDIMRVHEIRNILMDLIKDGKHPDEKTGKELKLGDGAGMNMLEGTADFTIIDEISEQKFEIFIKPLPRWICKTSTTTKVVGETTSEDV